MQFYQDETKPTYLPAQLICQGWLEQQGKGTRGAFSPHGHRWGQPGLNQELKIQRASPGTETPPLAESSHQEKIQAQQQITSFLFCDVSLNIRQSFHPLVFGFLSKDMESESLQINHCIFSDENHIWMGSISLDIEARKHLLSLKLCKVRFS